MAKAAALIVNNPGLGNKHVYHNTFIDPYATQDHGCIRWGTNNTSPTNESQGNLCIGYNPADDEFNTTDTSDGAVVHVANLATAALYDYTNGDYRLTSSSPASIVDSATNDFDTPATDMIGVSRDSTPDYGALESVGTSAGPAAPRDLIISIGDHLTQ